MCGYERCSRGGPPVIHLADHTDRWSCGPVIAATHIELVAATHDPVLHFVDLTLANPEMKIIAISRAGDDLLEAHCSLDGDDWTCVEWFAELAALEDEALVDAYLARVRARASAQRLRHRAIGFRRRGEESG